MIVAASTFRGEAEERGAEGVHAIHHVGHAIFLLHDAAFLILRVESVECRRQSLLLRWLGQEIPRDLPGDELIEGQILVERLDHPVAIRPHGAEAIRLVAVRVGETREVEPLRGHTLAIARRHEQPVHDVLVGVGRTVGHKGVDLLQCRWQAGEIEAHAAQPPFARRFRCGLKFFLFQTRQHKRVNGIVDLRWMIRDQRHRRMSGRDERPMLAPLRALIHPAFEGVDLLEREAAVGIHRRHSVVQIGGRDAADQFTCDTLPWNDDRILGAERAFLRVETQLGFAPFLVRPVAVIALVGKNRQDVPAVIHRGRDHYRRPETQSQPCHNVLHLTWERSALYSLKAAACNG